MPAAQEVMELPLITAKAILSSRASPQTIIMNSGVFILNHAGHIFFDTVTVNDNGANGAAIINDTGIYNITIKNSMLTIMDCNEGISGSLSIWSNGLVTSTAWWPMIVMTALAAAACA